MSQGGNSSSSTTASAPSTKPASPLPFKVELKEMYSRLNNAPNYSISDDLLTELKASRIATLEVKTEQEGYDHSMDARLGKAIFIANLRELAGRLEPREDKKWLTTFCEAFGCTETMLAFILFTGIEGVKFGDWYRGLGNHLDKSPDPVLALWHVLFPLLPHVRARVDKHFERSVVRDLIPPSLPPRRDYAALANINPTGYSSNDIVELIIPITTHSCPSTHPGLLIPNRLSTYEPRATSQHGRELDCTQLRLIHELRSGDYQPVPPTTLKKVVMERTIFESIALEGDADIRLANTRLAIQLYKGKITIECFDKMEWAMHTNLSFGTGYDADRFFIRSVRPGQKVKKVQEHVAGAQFKTIYKITRETAVDPDSHAAWSVKYCKPQMEFLVHDYNKIKSAPSPSQINHISATVSTPEPSEDQKRKRDTTSLTDEEEENQPSSQSNKRIRTDPSSTSMTSRDEGMKGSTRKVENVTINDASPSNESSSHLAAHHSFPTSSFRPNIPFLRDPFPTSSFGPYIPFLPHHSISLSSAHTQGNLLSPIHPTAAYSALTSSSYVVPSASPLVPPFTNMPIYASPFMSYGGLAFARQPFDLRHNFNWVHFNPRVFPMYHLLSGRMSNASHYGRSWM